MSWQDYVDAFLVNYTDQTSGKTATNIGEHGAIIGNTDGAVWASTAGFSLGNYNTDIAKDDGTTQSVQVNEFANLSDAFANNGATNKAGGIRINNEKYYIVSFDAQEGVMYLKKAGGGAAVAKSNLGYVIGTFVSNKKQTGLNGQQEPQNAGTMNRAVEALKTFLLDNNL
jgi:profilin